ncbi:MULTISPECIES: EAL domain-containing protein [unclassified Thioalkalivibrio]|uniref:EAL domain-containing protein n=1 Tax=unclassified Thioalkalivibrio TaxID=2621013 RepID=UPI0003635368|nr:MULTISPECIES: EAL domain-containing protein [unclassified Thioalkalivibrio]
MGLDTAPLTLLYALNGLAFFILGIVALMLPRRERFVPFTTHVGWLVPFGLLHGTYGFLNAIGLHHDLGAFGDRGFLAAWLAASYLPLLEFGRRVLLDIRPPLGLPAWLVYGALGAGLGAMLVAATEPALALANGARYLIGFPGALLTGIAFWLHMRHPGSGAEASRLVPALGIASVAFLAYAAFLPFPAQVDVALPQWLPSQGDFLAATGVPIQALRTAAAILFVLALISLARNIGAQHNDDLLRVLDTLNGFVYRCRNNPQWDVIFIHGEVRELTGYDPEDFYRGDITPAGCEHPDDAPYTKKAVQEALERDGTYQVQYRLVKRDGSVRWIFERGAGVYDEHGRLAYLQGHVFDAHELVTTSRELERRGEELEAFRSTLDLTLDGVFLFDVDSLQFIYVNQGAMDQTGRTREELLQLHPYDIKPEYPETRFRSLLEPLRRGERDQLLFETTHQHAAGHQVPVHISLQLVAPRGERPRYVAIVHDISQRKRNEAALLEALEDLETSRDEQARLLELTRREQGRMASLLSAMSIGILFEDRQGQIEYVNPAFRRMWAISDEIELIGQPSRAVLEHSTHRFARPDHASRHVLHVLDTHEISERFEVDLYDGRILTQLSYPVHDTDERSIGRLWLYEDVTHERQTAQQLVYLAEHDPLTGLYNRHRFQRRLDQAIQTARRRDTHFALIYFDLDEFKTINDTFGHRAGDTVLVRAAGEIASLVRGEEIFARLGGDEFAILIDHASEQEPEGLAERVARAISAIPFRFRGQNYRLTASIGIARYPEHGDNVEDLVAHADAAMYQAKDAGKNTWAVFDPSRNTAERMLERMSWSQRIGKALENGQFELHFQGIYHVENGALNHMEALVRMRDPLAPDEVVMPGQFIPVAEKTGQILDIDRWVIVEAIARLARHSELPGIAINISGRSFDEPGLPQYIESELGKQQVDPKRLIIELTETAAVSEMQDAQRFIEALQQTGCLVCLDDFGSGFSTFAYLKYLGVQVLKIDGMFVRDLANNRDNQAFIRAMVDVARGLEKWTVAECVEDAATLAMLADLGVDMVQGYYLHRPSQDFAPDHAP